MAINKNKTGKKNTVPVFLTLLFSIYLLEAPVLAQSCEAGCGRDRFNSAKKLISQAEKIQKQTKLLKGKAEELNKKTQEGANRVNWQAYQNLFSQYQQALAHYSQHRKDYYAHAQAFHSQPSINAKSVGLAPSPNTAFKPLQLKTELKCQQLVDLENQLFAAEKELSGYISRLVVASQSESSSQYASLWNDAKKLALEAQSGTSSFNHQAIQKGSEIQKSVSNLIASANRDGDYTEHMQAFQSYSQSNSLQQNLFKRADMHNRFVNSVLLQLDAIKPISQGGTTGGGNGPVSAEQLQQENRELEAEYANLQELMRRMEEVRATLPAKL